jgi:integrase
VFPSPLRSEEPLAVAVIDQAWRRIRTAAKLPDARLHDLRRTMGSWLAQGGASLPLIGRALNHKSQAVTAIYARLAMDSLRNAIDRHADALTQVGVSQDLL